MLPDLYIHNKNSRCEKRVGILRRSGQVTLGNFYKTIRRPAFESDQKIYSSCSLVSHSSVTLSYSFRSFNISTSVTMFSYALVLCFCVLFGQSSSSAIPMWEYLSTQEKVSPFFFNYIKIKTVFFQTELN